MRSRYLAGAAAVWTVGYAAAYVAVIRSQDDGSVAWWYFGLVLVAAVALATYAAVPASRPALVTGLVLGAIASLLGLLSIGILLVPAVAAAAAALATARRTPLAT